MKTNETETAPDVGTVWTDVTEVRLYDLLCSASPDVESQCETRHQHLFTYSSESYHPDSQIVSEPM